jgi:hypothetical protein
MPELFVRGKNTIDPEVIDPGGRSVEDSPMKSDFTFRLHVPNLIHFELIFFNRGMGWRSG